MTLKEAKNQVAKEYGADSWWSLDFAALPQESLRDEAAELYARSKWDEACYQQKLECDIHATNNGVNFNMMLAPKPEFKP